MGKLLDFIDIKRILVAVLVVGILILTFPKTVGSTSPNTIPQAPTVTSNAVCNATNRYSNDEVTITWPDNDIVRVDIRGKTFDTLPVGAAADNDYATNYYSKYVPAGTTSTGVPSGFYKADNSGRALAPNNQLLYVRTWNGRSYYPETTVNYTGTTTITWSNTDVVRVDIRGKSFATLPTGSTGDPSNNTYDYANNYYSKAVAAGTTSTTGPRNFFKADGEGRTMAIPGNQTMYVRTFNGIRYSPATSFSIACNPVSPPSPTPCSISGDFDGNGIVEMNDFDVWKNAFINGNAISNSLHSCDGVRVDLVLFNTWRSQFSRQ